MAATMRSACALALALAVVAMAATTTTMAQNSPEDYVAAHTAARAEVGLGQVWWDQNLADYAEWWANQRRGVCGGHSGVVGYGENTYWGPAGWPWSGVDAVNLWVDEKQYYDYDSNSCWGPYGCGHYTQVVWHDSTLIGCARVECDNDLGVFITCNYYPPGNWDNQRPYLAASSAA
jgi:pathogenesis-related protein 1